MIKKLFFLTIGMIPVLAFSQDIIIKENGEEFNCKITKEDSVNIYFTIKNKGVKVNTYVNKNRIKSYQYDTISKSSDSKSFMFEMNFHPFQDNGVFRFDYFQTKFWINNKTAFRLGVHIDYKKNSTTPDYRSNEQYQLSIEEKSLLLGIRPGFEFRILDNSKISPYWGFELAYKNKSSSSEYIEYDRIYDYDIDDYIYKKVKTDIDGAWRKVDFNDYYDPWGGSGYQTIDYTYERAYSSFGANLLMGTDFFLVKNIYFGFEVGIGYEIIKHKKIEIDISPSYGKETYPSSKSIDFGFYYNNSIRLGIWF